MTGAVVMIITYYGSIPSIVLYEERRRGEGRIYTSPGGGIDKGETPIEAAIRETTEEAYLKFPVESLNGGVKIGNCYFWSVFINKVDRQKFLNIRFGPIKLKSVQKEMYDLTFVPLENLVDSIRSGSIWVVDVFGKRIKLRKDFYNALRFENTLFGLIKTTLQSSV
jgi:8-oxo-dGTP pyrophosphatase MutT (NUDIX family)